MSSYSRVIFITVLMLTSIFMTSSRGEPLQALIFMFHETQVHCTVSQLGCDWLNPKKSWQQKMLIRVFHFSIVFFDCSLVKHRIIIFRNMSKGMIWRFSGPYHWFKHTMRVCCVGTVSDGNLQHLSKIYHPLLELINIETGWGWLS